MRRRYACSMAAASAPGSSPSAAKADVSPAIKRRFNSALRAREMARVTGLEPATSGVTGRRSNQLSYTRVFSMRGDLGEGLGGVNHRGLHFLAVLDLLLILFAGVGQGPVFEQESGDIGRTRSCKNRLHDDQQRDCKERAGRAPNPRPK